MGRDLRMEVFTSKDVVKPVSKCIYYNKLVGQMKN